VKDGRSVCGRRFRRASNRAGTGENRETNRPASSRSSGGGSVRFGVGLRVERALSNQGDGWVGLTRRRDTPVCSRVSQSVSASLRETRDVGVGVDVGVGAPRDWA
jgi:hypothetical protein